VRLWVFEKDLTERMAVSRENDVFLPGIPLPQTVCIGSNIGAAVEGADIVLTVMPSDHVRAVATSMKPHVASGTRFVSATKGIENNSLLRMSEVLTEVLDGPRLAVLSGPTFAREVARGDPAAVVIASSDKTLAREVQEAFSGLTFRLYTNDDPLGVEV